MLVQFSPGLVLSLCLFFWLCVCVWVENPSTPNPFCATQCLFSEEPWPLSSCLPQKPLKERIKGVGKKKKCKRELRECKWVSLCTKTPPEARTVGSHTHTRRPVHCSYARFACRSACWLCSAAQVLQEIPTILPSTTFLKEVQRKSPADSGEFSAKPTAGWECHPPLSLPSSISSDTRLPAW